MITTTHAFLGLRTKALVSVFLGCLVLCGSALSGRGVAGAARPPDDRKPDATATTTATTPAPVAKAPVAGGLKTTNFLLSIQTEKGEMRAYAARPVARGSYPGVIIAHEWWGLNQQIKKMADNLASEGYVVVIPDLYHGVVAEDPEKAHELMRGLTDERTLIDVKAGLAYLQNEGGVGTKPVGIMGFCMGGSVALKSGLGGLPLKAIVMFYGPPVTDPKELEKLSAPVLGLFGAEDQGIPAETVNLFKENAEKAGKKVDVKIYEKAGHAFMNETRPGYRPEAAGDAWTRALQFLAVNLKG